MPIAQASVGAGRPHDQLRIRRGAVAAEAELQRMGLQCRVAGTSILAGVGRCAPSQSE